MLVWLLALLAAAPQGPAAPPDAGAQYIVRNWGTADGLPQNTVTSIVQTRDGYLWLGTFGGLVRFDGHAFTVFDPGNTPGLVSARIVSLHEDGNGTLWIGTESGLTRRDGERFTRVGPDEGVAAAGVTALRSDRRGRVWIGLGHRLMRFDGRGLSPAAPGGPDLAALSLTESRDGTMWAGTWTSLMRFPDGGTPVLVPASAGPAGTVASLLTDSRGDVWVGASSLHRWDGKQFVHVPLPDKPVAPGVITALAEDRDGHVWIGTTRAGVYEWHDGVLAAYTTADGLTNGYVRSLFADRQGNIWVGTDVGGLYRLKPRRIANYQREDVTVHGIGPIVGDGASGLWVGGTCGGLSHFSGGRFENLGTKDGLPNPCVWALLRDPDDTVWIGTAGGGLTRFAAGRFESYAGKNGLPDAIVNGIARDRQGTLWVGTNTGLSRFDGSRFVNYGKAEGLSHDVKCIFQDRGGALWLGGVGGLTRFADGRFARFTMAQGLSHDHVRAIHEDADGVLWIGTYGGGLNRLQDGRFTAYGRKEGLPDTAVSRILEDARGFLWMSGNKGIFRVARSQLNDLAAGRIASVTGISYGTADGMVIDETNGGQPAGWQSADGRLWFPTIKGLVRFDPVTAAATPPPVFIERAIVNGQPVAAAALARLGPGSASAEFHYTAVDLDAAEKTRFRYRLDGYDGQWIDGGTRRVAYYTKIPPGRYDFEVAATDGDGNWSATPARMAVVVTPFWWQRREVEAVALILLLTATAASVRSISLRRARVRVAELERERALERERTRIARDLHDDLGSRLSHIAMMADASAAADPEARIAGAARAAVQTMDELVWAVNARNDTVENFAYYVAQYAEEHVIGAGLRCRLELPTDLPPRPLAADIRRHLYLAVKEAVNNALKHARASEIRLSLRIDTHALAVEVTDDGRGLPAAVDATGNGLKNFRERMDAAGGTLEVASAPGRGTRLTFTVPL